LKLSRIWLLCVLATGASTTLGQKIKIAPSQVMTDQTASILVTGAAPNSRVTIRAQLTDGAGSPWASEAEFLADSQGSIDTAKQAPVRGSYRIVSAMGLIWSMRPTSRDVHIYAAPHRLGPQPIQFQLIQSGEEVSSTQLVQLAIRPDVQQIRIDGVLHGVFFRPDGNEKHPGILVVGGAEGGAPLAKAAWVASHGYAALALCYFHCAGTPQKLENIPLEYFGLALGWMMKRSEVAADHIAIMGTSRGGELALQFGSIYPKIKAVVAYVPADFRYPSCCQVPFEAAWIWKGQPLAWAFSGPNRSFGAITNALIAVENTSGPILMIGAQNDGVWPSAEMVEAAAERLRARHFAYPVVVLIYPHAGHFAGLAAIEPTWSNGVADPISGRGISFGGTPEGNAESTVDAVPKVLDFLQKNLAEASPAK
jgi:dienelactone hydrolase